MSTIRKVVFTFGLLLMVLGGVFMNLVEFQDNGITLLVVGIILVVIGILWWLIEMDV